MEEDPMMWKEMPPLPDQPETTSRRYFLKVALGAGISLPVMGLWYEALSQSQTVILANSKGMLVSDSTRCVGCKLCELACTEYNEGRSQPTLARMKVSRNYNYGPRGQQAGTGRGMGQFGNLRLLQDVCLQCPHPVPCATACPYQAIVMDPQTGARKVDPDKCRGCRMCRKACPWDMMNFDEVAAKATKCFLCNGTPQCVEVCPSGALRFVAWHDLTRAVPVRQATLSLSKENASAGCLNTCHSTRR